MAMPLYDLLPRDENLSSDTLLGRFLDYVAGRRMASGGTHPICLAIFSGTTIPLES